jgi:glycosyltransferase involved in cell wall biosynthesis
VITVSQILYSALGVYARVDQTKVRVIHNGVSARFGPQTDARVLLAARNRHSLPERFAFWAGDFRPEKNLIFLIEAWARLRRRLPDLPVLVMAGEKRGDYGKVLKEVVKQGLQGQVLFPGFIPYDDLPAVYSAATVFVFPSLYEGFGLPPLEAMSCGTPCVVSNSSSLPEVTGSAALLFNPTSLDAFEDCVVRILTDPELSASLREAGLRQAALFPWSLAAEDTIRVYREALGEPGTPAPAS